MIGNRIFSKDISVSLLEQLSLNTGNFLFFIISAKLSGPEQFGLFSILIVGAQIILALAVQWIFLPITSKNLSYTNNNIIVEVLKKILILAIFSPLFIWVYSRLLSNENVDSFQFVLVYILGISMVMSDATRYYLIRVRKVNVLLFSNITKWIIAFVLLFSFIDKSENQHLIILSILVVTLCIGLSIQLFSIGFKSSRNSLKINNLDVKSDNPLLNLGVANIFNTIAITLLFNKVNIVAFGALQAFRSLVNIFPFFLQFLESHYSAIMVTQGKTNFIKKKWIFMYAVMIVFLSIVLSMYVDNIIKFIYGYNYITYNLLFILLFIIVSIQNLSRLLSIQLRLQEKYTSFNYSAVILWVSTLLMFVTLYYISSKLDYRDILYYISSKLGYSDMLNYITLKSNYMPYYSASKLDYIMLIMLFTALIQMINFIYYTYKLQKKI